MDQVNRAQGEAEAILAKAQATAKRIALISRAIKESGGTEAVSLKVAEQYIQALSSIAKESTMVLLPGTAADPSNAMAQAFSIYKNLVGSVSEDCMNSSSETKQEEDLVTLLGMTLGSTKARRYASSEALKMTPFLTLTILLS